MSSSLICPALRVGALRLFLLVFPGCLLAATGDPNPPVPTPGADVYVGGYQISHGGRMATLWKNGQATALAYGDGDSLVSALAVSGTDVYAVGRARVAGHVRAVSWKNSVPTALSAPTQEAEAKAILLTVNPVNRQTNVYIAGWCGKGKAMVATYWVNGTGVPLGDGVHDSVASAVAAKDGDIYVGGWVRKGKRSVATIWKNGKAVTLTDGRLEAQVTGLSVAGSDLFAVGMENGPGIGVIKLWKNLSSAGIEVSDRGGIATATGLVVRGADIYVAGTESRGQVTLPKVWKNGHGLALSPGPQSGAARALCLAPGKQAYLAGWEADGKVQVAKLWTLDETLVSAADPNWTRPDGQPQVQSLDLSQHRESAQALALVVAVH